MYYEDENNLYHYSYRKGDRVENVRDVDYTDVPPTEHKTDPWEEKKPKKNRFGMKITALALCCALIGGFVGAGVTHYAASGHGTTAIEVSTRQVAAVKQVAVDGKQQLNMPEVYASNVNSVVSINVSSTSTNVFGQTTESAASGSGFFITKDGYIITNYHVIKGANTVKVTTYDGTTYDAAIVGGDEDYDIAVIKIEGTSFQPVVLGDSSSVQIGEAVAAIGNPLGELTFSLTSGAVSALDREVTFSNNVTMDLIQTDCAINSGNSGGALFNLYGEVIGITNAKYSGSSSSSSASIDNIGFAIPINHVKSIVKSIIETGSITKPYIGVRINNVSSEAQAYGLPAGAAIYSIEDDSPAQKAGLQENDIVTEVDGKTISTTSELVELVGEKAIGDELKLKVYRQGETIEITVTVGEQTTSALPQENTEDTQQQSQQQYQQGGQSFPWGNFFGN